jgi:hypothetical protein|tara:strand:+ start:1319 stop:2464 length:1146 start_codon:yes stop_codon:yes gene_type:complete
MRIVEFKNIDQKRLILKELSPARINHAEDLIFWEGSAGAMRAVQQLEQLAKGTKSLTIKWDGSPAIIFGRNPNGEFIFTDKHGFMAKSYDGRATSPDDLEGAIMQRAKDKSKAKTYRQYASKMKSVFELFQNAVPNNFQGYFVGDMLYFNTPKKVGNSYVFQPNVVNYQVPAETDLGKRMGSSRAGVVVHYIMSEKGRTMPVKDLNMIQGTDVLAIPPTTVNKSQPVDVSAVNQLKGMIQQSSSGIDKLLDRNALAGMKLADFPNLLYTYLNSKVDSGMKGLGSDFVKWLQSSAVTEVKKTRIMNYIKANTQSFMALWKIVNGIMTAKDSIIRQLDKSKGAVNATVNGKPGGEGYVLKSPKGNIKLVRRSGFTKANRAINR